MSNVKDIIIRGEMPFNITDNAEARSWLGMLNGPSLGIRIEYKGRRMQPNEHGGKTAMYRFSITGQEAVRWEMLRKMCEEFKAAGATIDQAIAMDIEDTPSRWASVI